MENSRNEQQERGRQGSGNLNRSTDTSLPGREEEVVNNQEQNRRTNSDIGDITNKSAEGTRRPAEPYQEKPDRSKTDRQNISTGSQPAESGTEDKGFKKGMGDNDNRNAILPDAGKDDAEKA